MACWVTAGKLLAKATVNFNTPALRFRRLPAATTDGNIGAMKVQHFEAFRKNVRLAMDDQGISLRTMAPHIGTSHTYLHRMLSGEFSPSLDRCEQIARYLEIPLAALIQKKFKITA